MTGVRSSTTSLTNVTLRFGQVWLAVFCVVAAASVVSGQEVDKKLPTIEMLVCNVLVLDPDSNPVEGATVYCSGMRTRNEPGSHWGWSPETHGPLPRLTTDADGMVRMPYPKYVDEKLETGQMTWSVEHPDFVDFRQDRSVDDDPAEIKLERGFRIALTALHEKTGEKITSDLYAVIAGSSADWKLSNNGMLISPVFAKQDTTLRVCQISEGQPIRFSKSIKIEPGDRSRVLLRNVKLSAGTRVEGRLDDSVPRPIKNGHVSASIVRSMNPNQWRTRWNWYDKTPIESDGTFVFESMPTDEVLQMIAVCDGWVPSNPEEGSVLAFFPSAVGKLKGNFTVPQIVELQGEKVTPVLAMHESTSVKVTVKDPDGQPLSGAKVVMWPNQLWFDSGSQILGDGYSQSEFLVKTRAGGFDYDRQIRFSSSTDENGVALIKNLPVNKTESLAVSHDDFDMPISGRDRSIRVDLKPGEVAEVTIQMQEKGVDALGDESELEEETGAEKDNDSEENTSG